MNFKLIYIFVEGPDDQRFFEKVIKPYFQNKYSCINVICYREMLKKKLKAFIRAIEKMNDADYIYTRDFNNSVCVTRKKQKILKKNSFLKEKAILIIIREIESWYLAGLCQKDLSRFKIKKIEKTNDLFKEAFDKCIPKRFTSRIDFMNEILKCFSIKEASRKNESFLYFARRYNIV